MLPLAVRIKNQKKRYHNKVYVNYSKEATRKRLTKDALESKLEDLISHGYVYAPHCTIRANIKPMTYSLCYNARNITLTTYDGQTYNWYTTNYHDDAKNKDTGTAFSQFRRDFLTRTGKTMTQAFGATPQAMKTCCPQPLYYRNQFYAKNRWLSHVKKEDFSSHYPSNAIGYLPDASTAKEIKGRVKPDSVYRFAFYVKSGHVAEYGRFDSHDYLRQISIYSAKTTQNRDFPTAYNISDDDEITILMKASDYNLDPEMQAAYDKKNNSPKDSEDYKQAKLFMLKFIGQLEQCNPNVYLGYPYAHIAAVIKWRANIKTFNTLKAIGEDKIIQVCVDGFIHQGKTVGCTKKALGNLITEFDDARFIQRGLNQYILKQGDKDDRKSAGLDTNIDDDDITHWGASPKVNYLAYMQAKYEMEKL
jgi:hypothetical protein